VLQNVKITNPFGRKVQLKPASSKPDIFGFSKSSSKNNTPGSHRFIELEAHETVSVELWHLPLSVEQTVEAQLRLTSENAGEWIYKVKGEGSTPEVLPPVEIRCPIHAKSPGIMFFRSPFTVGVDVHLSLVDRNGKALHSRKAVFALTSSNSSSQKAGRSSRRRVKAKGTYQIPFIFKPTTMVDHYAEVHVRVTDKITFRLPIIGRTQAAQHDVFYIKTQARNQKTQVLELELGGLEHRSGEGFEEFRHEINYPEENKKSAIFEQVQRLLKTCLEVKLLDTRLEAPANTLRLEVKFEPLRAVSTHCNVIVFKKSGGCWNFTLDLKASNPDVDDVIKIHASPGSSKSVAFALNNMLEGPAKFKAYFSKDTPIEFFVSPSTGLLRPEGEEPTTIVVSFSPKEYGKTVTGTLIIMTNMMQWTYQIRGVYPRYSTPQVESRLGLKGVNFSVPVRPATTGRPRRNYLRKNAMAVRILSNSYKDSGRARARGGSGAARSRRMVENSRRQTRDKREVDRLPQL